MRYSLKQINELRFSKNRSRERKLAEIYIPLNLIGKAASLFPTYVFINLGIHPDFVTLLSILSVLAGCILLLLGQAVGGASFFLLFILFDSVDGDMARVKGPSTYGNVLDSFGADVFYGLAPLSLGYFLWQKEVNVWLLSEAQILFLSALVSLSFIFYRLINVKVFHYRNTFTDKKSSHNQVAKEAVGIKGVVRFLEMGRHVLLRGNFFSEPGMVFWFFLLIFFWRYELLAIYLVMIFAYNAAYLIMNFIGAYLYFRHSEKSIKGTK